MSKNRLLWLLVWASPGLIVVGGAWFGTDRMHVDRPPMEPRFEARAAAAFLERFLTLGPRAQPQTRRRAAEALAAEARGWSGCEVRVVEFARSNGDLGWNVFAEFPGQGPHREDRIVFLAHHDSVEGAPGALDNGTGCALLVGLGRALAGRSLARTVVLAAPDLEEEGLVGARAWAESEVKAGTLSSVRAVIATEMLAWRDGSPVLHTFPTAFYSRPTDPVPCGGLAPRWLVALSLAIGRQSRGPAAFGDPWLFPVYHVLFRHFPSPFDSDSGAFAERGVPALFWSDCSFSRFYPHYHRSTDRHEQVDLGRLRDSGDALEAMLLALNDRETLPRPSAEGGDGEVDYFTIGGLVIPGLSLRAATLLAMIAALWRAWQHRIANTGARGGWTCCLAAAGLTCYGVLQAPVTAFVLLTAGWLAGPGACSSRWPWRIAAALAALALPAFCLIVTVQAMAAFHSWSLPYREAAALWGCLTASALLAVLAVLPRRTDTTT